jgi:UDP-N-acetylbacillosamine N-acetyltransferase
LAGDQRPIILYGAGPFAQLVRYRIEEIGWSVAAFAVDPEYVTHATVDGLPVVSTQSLASIKPPMQYDLVIAIGYRSMRARANCFIRATQWGYRMPSVISTAATIAANATLGANNLVFPGVVIEPFAAIGNHNVFWPGTVVCHHSRVGHFNYFSPGSIVAGNCMIGDECFLGTRASAIDGVHMPDGCHLLPGSILQQNAAAFGVYGGIPATRRRDIDPSVGIEIESRPKLLVL